MRAIGYIRVSTEDQALGPAAQRTAIERWAAAAGAEVVSWHEDIGVSGGAPLEERPGLLAALEALRALQGPKKAPLRPDAAYFGPSNEGPKTIALVVAKRDRLARDPIVSALVERMAERAGATVISAAGEGNGSDPADQLMRRIVDAFAEYERLLIGHRTRAALRVKKSRGERTGSVPYGYALAADGIHLRPVEAEQQQIHLARELAACGHSLRAIGSRLTALDGRAWHPQSVARLLAPQETTGRAE